MKLKNWLSIIIPALAIASVVWAQSYYSQYYQHPTNKTHSGEHSPLVYTSRDTLFGGTDTAATAWMQIGWTPYSTTVNPYFDLNPENFTLTLYFGKYGAGDSVRLSAARFELADSSAAVVPMWNADSTNLFVADGNYNHALYGQWMFEDIAKLDAVAGNKAWVFPLRVMRGSYIRFIFSTAGAADTTIVKWTLWCEN